MYRPVPLPIPSQIVSDMCDYGNPPDGHARVVLLKINDGNPIVLPAGIDAIAEVYARIADVAEHEHDLDGEREVFCDECPFVEYRTDTCPQEILDMLPEYVSI